YRWCRFVSGFCAWSDRSESRGGSCNRKLGNGLGTDLQQGFGVPAAGSDICDQRQPALNGKARIDRDGLGVCVRYYCLFLAACSIKLLIYAACAACSALCVDWARSQQPAKRYASFQNKFALRLPVPEFHSVPSMKTSSPLPAPSAKE